MAMVSATRYEEFALLLQQTTRQLLTYLNAVLFRSEDAEDVFQETCLVLWEKFDEFQPGTNFLGWALCVARNKAMAFQARQARHRRFWTPDLQNALVNVVANQGPASVNADADALADCVDRLGESDRGLLRRCYGENVPVRQVAGELGRSPQSVHNSLRRIRAVLLECVKQAREVDG
jgi:RNA polymerase sigma-70 factor (ECF subfamily)